MKKIYLIKFRSVLVFSYSSLSLSFSMDGFRENRSKANRRRSYIILLNVAIPIKVVERNSLGVSIRHLWISGYQKSDTVRR